MTKRVPGRVPIVQLVVAIAIPGLLCLAMPSALANPIGPCEYAWTSCDNSCAIVWDQQMQQWKCDWKHWTTVHLQCLMVAGNCSWQFTGGTWNSTFYYCDPFPNAWGWQCAYGDCTHDTIACTQ